MEAPLTLILAIGLLGLVYVVLPVVIDAYRRFAGTKMPTCPETRAIAAVELDAKHAALTAAVGIPELRVKNCSRWPEHRDCGQECIRGEAGDSLTTSIPFGEVVSGSFGTRADSAVKARREPGAV